MDEAHSHSPCDQDYGEVAHGLRQQRFSGLKEQSKAEESRLVMHVYLNEININIDIVLHGNNG